MKELDIKAALLNRLRSDKVLDSRAVLTTEFRISGSSVRADLAILTDKFIGVEIKSRFDTLRRLPRQVSAYSAYFDRTIVVIAEEHLPSLEPVDLTTVELWTLRAGDFEVVGLPRQAARKAPMSDLLTAAQRGRHRDLDRDGGRAAFIAEFRTRFGPTSSEFWKQVRRSSIRADNLSALSRFQPRRELGARMRAERALSWSQWNRAIEST